MVRPPVPIRPKRDDINYSVTDSDIDLFANSVVIRVPVVSALFTDIPDEYRRAMACRLDPGSGGRGAGSDRRLTGYGSSSTRRTPTRARTGRPRPLTVDNGPGEVRSSPQAGRYRAAGSTPQDPSLWIPWSPR